MSQRGGGMKPWEIEGIADRAREAAEAAATAGGVPLHVWLSDAVLRACQEGPAESPENALTAPEK